MALRCTTILDGSPFTDYGEGRADSAATKLMNQDTASSLSEHAQVFSATLRDFGALADYDYLVMGITRDPAEGRGNGTVFYDVSLTAEVAVPEPAQLATLLSASLISADPRIPYFRPFLTRAVFL